jgi:ketosteroid isomerase-like protein
VRAENAHDLDTLLALAHDRVVFVGPFDPFPVEGKAVYRQVWQRWFDTEQFTVTLTHPQGHAFGSTGLAWGLYTLVLKPKDGPIVTSSGRYTLTFSRMADDGRWLLVAFHASRLPAECE